MITAIKQRFTGTGTNSFEEDPRGACIGVKWSDEHGNEFRAIHVDTPVFSSRMRYGTMLYQLYSKAVGRGKWNLEEELIDIIDDSKYFYSSLTSGKFGKREDEPYEMVDSGDVDAEGEPIFSQALKTGLDTQVQFFVDNMFFNINNISLSFEMFVYPFIAGKYELNIVAPSE